MRKDFLKEEMKKGNEWDKEYCECIKREIEVSRRILNATRQIENEYYGNTGNSYRFIHDPPRLVLRLDKQPNMLREALKGGARSIVVLDGNIMRVVIEGPNMAGCQPKQVKLIMTHKLGQI